MESNKIINAICKMAEDDNYGLKMSTKVLNACTNNDISEVTFQVDVDVIDSAFLQSVGLSGEYMCFVFAINRKELKKYKKLV